LDVDDLTLALFITPATLTTESDMNLPLLIGTGVGGLLIGFILSLLIKKRS